MGFDWEAFRNKVAEFRAARDHFDSLEPALLGERIEDAADGARLEALELVLGIKDGRDKLETIKAWTDLVKEMSRPYEKGN